MEWRECTVCSSYLVSDEGDIKHKQTGKIRKQKLNKDNYLEINLSMGSRHNIVHRQVHRLVAEAFIPNPENKATVNHIDCNRHNNNVKNLEWATYRENNDYALKVMREQGENKRNNKASKPIIEYDLEMNFIAEYPSVREAERRLGYKGICACLVGKQKTVHGHIFKYKQL